jgi:histidinol-phosphate aminotransferase
MSIKINNKTYQAIIFDVDDTLIDTSKSYDEAIKKTVKKFTSAEISDDDLSLVRSKGIYYGVNNDWNVTWLLMELVKQFPKEKWEETLTNNMLSEIQADLEEYLKMKVFFQHLYLGNPYFNGQGLIDTAEKKMYLDNFFPTLKAHGVICAIVTSRPTEEALYALKEVYGLVGDFIETDDLIISSGSKNALGKLIAEKPSPEPILECINRLSLNAKDCVYIGNSSSDYIAAREAGVDFIQVGFSQIDRNADGFNYFKLNSVNELLFEL